MPTPCPIRRCLISVYDKTGIVEFARALHEEFGIEIISTGGTAKTLREAGIPVTLIEDITGFPEMLDGRVKTLHPAIHAGILADRDNPEHMRQLEAHGIKPIDMVVVNLYPFEKTVADPNCTFEQAIEMIDIGGVTLLRAAAKNHKHVLTVSGGGDAEDYQVLLKFWRELRQAGAWPSADRDLRASHASGDFNTTAWYDSRVAAWLSEQAGWWPKHAPLWMSNWGPMRYGENPHQLAELYSTHEDPDAQNLVFSSDPTIIDVQTRLSHNNYLDADAALRLCAELARAKKQASEVKRKLGQAQGGLWDRFSTGRLCATGFQPVASFPRVSEEQYFRRHLPHLQRPGSTYFITFRLKQGALAPPERDIALNACTHWHGKKMTLHRAVVMPDHVHLLMTPHEVERDAWIPLSEILHSIKRFSAGEINKLRGTSGPLWQDESFDRVIRNQAEFIEKWEYIEANPVTAGLVNSPEQYRWGWKSDTEFQETVHIRDRLETCHTEADRLETGPTDTPPTQTDRLKTCPTAPHACVFIKHTNACGAAVHGDPIEAYRKAYLGDPNAAMGGILAVDFAVDAAFAAVVMETYARFGKPLKDAGAAHAPGGFFVEVWIAPHFTDDAVAVIRGKYDPATAKPEPGEPRLGIDAAPPAPKKDWGQRVRLLAVGDMTVEPDPDARVYRSIAGGMLVQTPDLLGLNEDQWTVATNRAPTEAEMDDLRLAWLVCKHTKSNAITICRDGMLLGNGAGQMSRVMSCRLSTWLARENGHSFEGNREQGPGTRGEARRHEGTEARRGEEVQAAPSIQETSPVAASDAFFPFPDGPRILIDAGVTALIQPGGGKRDQETIDLCNERGVAMIFTGTRHFRH